MRIESGDRGQRVVAAPMRIAGQVIQRAQFAEDSHIGPSAQSRLHLGHGEGTEAFKQVQQRLENNPDGSHIVRIPPIELKASGILTLLRGDLTPATHLHNPIVYWL